MAYKNILGIGNALVDILTQISNDDILNQLSLPKGSMQHVDAAASKAIGEALKPYGSAMAAGGSAANTISGAAKLGIETGYIGKVGNDDLGKFFENEMVKTNVKPLMMTTATPTGCAQAVISGDGERTFATYLGAALELSPDDLKPELFDGWDILYVEGYLVFNRPLVDRALAIAKSKGMKVAIDLASYNVVEANRDYMNDIVKNYIDIVFANQEESRSLTGMDDPEAALHEIASMCDIAVVKVGAKGAYVQHGDEVVKVAPIPAKVIDTTGAGDMWAAGFMAGFVKGETLEKCAKTGAIVAANIIEVIGAKMDENRWKKIFFEIN
ncbi:MAG: adenosine kinase [Bacteroidales bacterium]|nr:adenosine kinase [Bacteroidales bacterium]